MAFVIESLNADWEAFLRFAPRLFYGLVLLLVFFLAAKLSGRIIANIIHRSGRMRANERFLQHVVSWSIASLGILLSLGVMGFHGVATSLLATGGVVAIVLGFAFREIGENFLAGFFLTFSRPFDAGDLVKTGELTGIVHSIELRHVHIRTFDACDVFVPSAQIFREPLYNYTRDGLRRPSFTVGIAYHDEPEKVIHLLEETVKNVPDVTTEPRSYVSVKEFGGEFVVYEVYFWFDVSKSERSYVEIDNEVKVSCWRALRDAGMTFSTDVTTGLEIQTVADLKVAVETANRPPLTN